MALPTKKVTKRVQIDMPDSAFARLERLRDATEAASIAEVIRAAIELREAVVNLRGQGYEIIARKGDETKTLYLPAMRVG